MSSIVALPPPAQLTPVERVRGLAALAAASVVLTATRSRPARLRKTLTGCAMGARPATYQQAERADAVITTLSPRCGSGRHCLTRSIAVALYCRMAGVWPTWRSGVRYPPLESHAWIEVGGRTVGEPGQFTAAHTPTITVTATKGDQPVTVTRDAIADRLTAYTDQLREQGAIRTDQVADAFATVPRHLFINTIYNGDRIPVGEHPSEELLDRIYSDRSLMTHVPGDEADGYSSASQPSLVAKMIEALDLRPGMRVLEIGAGTGYNAALIATITSAPVVTLDVSKAVADEAAHALQRAEIEKVTAVYDDGYLGHTATGPYDRIIVTCGVTGISPHWLNQLADNGFALVPTAHGGLHPILAITRTDDEVHARAVMSADFMTATGPLYHWPQGRVPTPSAAVPADTLTTVPGIGLALEFADYQAMWFHLAANDHRITRAWTDGIDPTQGLCALHDPDTATAWIQRNGTAHHTGGTALLDRLTHLVTDWDQHGRPAISDWTCTLQQSGPDHEPIHVVGDWRLTQ